MIYIASDHAGFELKQHLISFLQKRNVLLEDLGPESNSSIDYPDKAHLLAKRVLSKESSKGILICGSGIGVSIAANRHKGIRAALCWTLDIARLCREHNDANVICLPARFVTEELAEQMVDIFFSTQFEGGRHEARVSKIEQGC